MEIELPDPSSKPGQTLQQALLPEETIVAAVLNQPNRRSPTCSVLVATNLRAIIVKGRQNSWGMTTSLATGYHYRQMTGITMKTSPMMSGRVEILAAGVPPEHLTKRGEEPNIFTFLTIGGRKEAVAEAVAYINQQVASATISPSQPSVGIPEQIRQLAALRDAGVLSNEEFEAKKAELLSRM